MKKDIMSYCGDDVLDAADRNWDSAVKKPKLSRFAVIAAAALIGIGLIAAFAVAMATRNSVTPPPETEIVTEAETEAETQTDTKEPAQTAAETVETVIPKEEITSDYVIFKDAADDNSGLHCHTNGYEIKGHYVIEEDNTKNSITICYPDSSFEQLIGSLNDTEYDLLGKKHTDVCEYEIQIYNLNYYHKKWITLLVPDESIELITPEIPYCYYERSEERNYDDDIKTINVSFRFKENCHNGNIWVYIFAGDNSIKAFENDYKDADIQEIRKNSDRPYGDLANYNTSRKVAFACVKGYDFSDYYLGVSNLYRQAAIYFGDVDKNGNPLYLTDPNMPDYKDSPSCIEMREKQEDEKRIREEAHEKAQAREKEQERGNTDAAPLVDIPNNN